MQKYNKQGTAGRLSQEFHLNLTQRSLKAVQFLKQLKIEMK